MLNLALILILNFSAWSVDLDETALLPEEFKNVGIDKSVTGKTIDVSRTFTDESGKTGALSSFFLKDKPNLISIIYYGCPGLCNLHMNGAGTLFEDFSLKAGKDFNWILLTMDSSEKPDLAFKKKQNYMEQYPVEGAQEGWKFLTASPEVTKQITEDMGFSYKWDDATKQFAHSAAFYVLTPTGEISQIIPGVGFEESTVRLALVAAGKGEIGSIIDQILLFCFRFDPTKNKYTLYAFNLMRAASVLMVVVLGVLLIPMWRKESFRGASS